MKTDINGRSTTPPGREQYETFATRAGKRVQYDYRTPSDKLFSCVAQTLTAARAKRDAWLAATSAPHFGKEGK